MSNQALVSVSEWHKDIFNWEIEHPGVNLSVCAAHFNVGETWLSTIRNSDIYQEYASQQRLLHNHNVSKSVIDNVEELAGVSIEVLKERIKRERDTIGLGVVNDTASMALKALGFGNKGNGRGEGTSVNVFLGAAAPAVLERARDKMRLVNTRPQETGPCGAERAPIPITIDEEPNDADAKPLPAPA